MQIQGVDTVVLDLVAWNSFLFTGIHQLLRTIVSVINWVVIVTFRVISWKFQKQLSLYLLLVIVVRGSVGFCRVETTYNEVNRHSFNLTHLSFFFFMVHVSFTSLIVLCLSLESMGHILI